MELPPGKDEFQAELANKVQSCASLLFVQSSSFPELSAKGAFDAGMTYSNADVQR